MIQHRPVLLGNDTLYLISNAEIVKKFPCREMLLPRHLVA